MKFLTIWRMPTVRHVPPELAHPASSPSSPPSPPLFRVCVRARGRARPRCEAAEITGSLLRPPAANPKEANAMSERSLRINSGRRRREGILRMEANGGGIYIGEGEGEKGGDGE